MRSRLVRCLFLILPLLLTACGRRDRDWNVLFVTVDTLRANRMSLYGYERPTTPRLEAFAREAVVFNNSRSQAGCTFPSVNSFLTSRHPAFFLDQPGGTLGIPATVRALPEILRERGYATAAVSASSIVRNTPHKMNPNGGFGRGFDQFDEECNHKHGRCLNEKALAHFEKLPEPWFLYLHYLEPHAPYLPPLDYTRRIAPTPAQARTLGVNAWARKGEAWPVSRVLYDGNKEFRITPQNLTHLSDLYDEEIAYFDEQFSQLIETLRERDLLDRTLIVLTADHGEELYDHGHFGHCRNLGFETILKTPLVMRIPGAPQGVRRDGLAENLDLVPTILDYLGIPAEGQTFDGLSLRPVIEEDRRIRRLSFGMQGVTRIVSDGTHKLSYNLNTSRARLYNLKTDPHEKTDLSAQHPDLAGRLQVALLRWMESREGPAGSGESRRKAEELEKQLRALGYL